MLSFWDFKKQNKTGQQVYQIWMQMKEHFCWQIKINYCEFQINIFNFQM